MEIGSSSAATITASNAVQVSVLNSQRKQLEAVVGTLLQGTSETASRIEGQTGQKLNVVA